MEIDPSAPAIAHGETFIEARPEAVFAVIAAIDDWPRWNTDVKAVELEFVRFAHEADVETTVRVRYEDGTTGTSTKRLALSDVPDAVREDFEKKGASRVFRSWPFPWQRVRAL